MKTFFNSAMDALRSYVDERCNGNVTKAAEALGMKNPSILHQWLSGRRSPTLLALGPVFDAIGIRLDVPSIDLAEYELVPKHAAKAGAGASLETSDDVEGMYAFRTDWLTSLGMQARNAALMDVIGDSMEPLLREGDTLLLDKAAKEIMDGKIYVITLGDELRVKRIYKGVDGILLRSENSRYPDVPVSAYEMECFIIHGRVKWCGKLL